MTSAKIVLIINNNPDGSPGRYTSQLCQRVQEANIEFVEARTLAAVDVLANRVGEQSDVGLIITCGSPLVLTDPQNLQEHITKTTAAMLHFPNAPVVGICFGMQLLACLYGGEIRSHVGHGHTPGQYIWLKRLSVPSRFLEDISEDFMQWGSNYIFVERTPSRFIATSADSIGRIMSMEHVHEHVYGVQFHPEVLHEGLGRKLIDGMMRLLGRNRRDVGLRKKDCPSEVIPWKCSQNCSLRKAIKEATRDTSPSRPISNLSVPAEPVLATCEDCVGKLAGRLAVAKRDALAKLQQDHCRLGGITISALQDAISGLRGLASAPPLPIEARFPEEDGTCSPHEADLQLRSAINETLVAVSHQKSARVGLSISAVSTASKQQASCLAEKQSQKNQQHGCSEGRCSLHDADIQLRRIVRAELDKDGTRFPGLGRALAVAKSAALAELRTNGLQGVAIAQVETSCASMRAAASSFRRSVSVDFVS